MSQAKAVKSILQQAIRQPLSSDGEPAPEADRLEAARQAPSPLKNRTCL